MFDKFPEMKHHHQLLFALLIAFAVVAFWRGAWGIMDVYLLPDNYELSSWISLLAGIVILASTHYATRELI